MPDDKNNQNQGGGDGGDNAGGDAPKYITEEQLNKALSAGMSGMSKRLEGKFASTIQSAIAAALGKKEDVSDDDEGDDEDDKETPPKPNDKALTATERRLKKLEQENKKLLASLDSEKKARDEEATKSRRTSERDALRKALVAGGVMEQYLDDLVEARYAQGLVRTDEDGNIVWKKGKDEEVPLSEGIADYLKSPQGKAYLPPTGKRGSGNTPGNGKASGGGSKGPEVSDQDLLGHLLG